jgi:hypothetical protein
MRHNAPWNHDIYTFLLPPPCSLLSLSFPFHLFTSVLAALLSSSVPIAVPLTSRKTITRSHPWSTQSTQYSTPVVVFTRISPHLCIITARASDVFPLPCLSTPPRSPRSARLSPQRLSSRFTTTLPLPDQPRFTPAPFVLLTLLNNRMDREDAFRVPKIERNRAEDCIRILATDCHVGYAERDLIRG